MKVLIVINGAPYGTERVYNAFRLAMTLQREHADLEVRVFLMSDSVTCALPHQFTPQGYYNVERMLKAVVNKGVQVKVCGVFSEKTMTQECQRDCGYSFYDLEKSEIRRE